MQLVVVGGRAAQAFLTHCSGSRFLTGALLHWLLLGLLTLGALLNSIGIAGRLVTRATEVAIATATLFFFLLAAPVLVLGYANALDATHLGITACAVHVGTFYLLVRGRSVREHMASSFASARAMGALPYDALVAAGRDRSFALVGLTVSYAIIAYALFITIVLPINSWDGFMYHEPIVGFALQNHGFAPVELGTNETNQAINGYPKLCECLSIWFVIFTDRTLVELPDVLAAPLLMLAVYALSRRYGDRMLSLTWASVALLMPQTWVQLCWIYIDVLVAFFAIAAIYFATKPECRVRDIVLATVALGLLAGSKFSSLTLVPVIGLVAAIRLARAHARRRPVTTAGVILGSAVFLAGVNALPLIHNFRYFKNPIWPVTYDNAHLGVHWKGLRSMREIVADATLRSIVSESYDLPSRGFSDIHFRGYGYAIAWIVVPLGAVGLGYAALMALTKAIRRSRDEELRNLTWVIAITVASVFVTPTLIGRNARYNLHILAGAMAAATWMLRGRAWVRTREGVIGASVVLSLYPLGINSDQLLGWGVVDALGPSVRDALSHHTYLTRSKFDSLGKFREAELHTGDRVAFDEGIPFISALWNFHYSNELKFVPSAAPASFLESLRVYDPKWVAVGNDQDQATLNGSEEWHFIGRLSAAGNQLVFRHVGDVGRER